MVRRCGPLGQCCDVEYFISFPRSLLTLLFTESSNSCIRYLVTNTDVVICHIYIANITLSTGEEVSPEDVPLCIGQKVIVMCSITGLALRWRYERSSAFYNSIVMSPQPLNSFQTELNSIFNCVHALMLCRNFELIPVKIGFFKSCSKIWSKTLYTVYRVFAKHC